jgi:hypothetical protein
VLDWLRQRVRNFLRIEESQKSGFLDLHASGETPHPLRVQTNTPAWKRKRPLGSHAPRPRPAWGSAPRTGPPQLHDTVVWERTVEPRERYRITYTGGDGETSEREIELVKIGRAPGLRAGDAGTPYLGVQHMGKFKTLRADRVTAVTAVDPPDAASIRAWPTYAFTLPMFHVERAVYRIAATATPRPGKPTRHWQVDLNRYTCTCPEKRERSGKGYAPGQLGFVCDHMAKAILQNLPANVEAEAWTPELRSFLADPRKVHIDNLTPQR